MIDLEEGVIEEFESAAERARRLPRVRLVDASMRQLEVMEGKRRLREIDRTLRRARAERAATAPKRNTLPDEGSLRRVEAWRARRNEKVG